MWQFWFVTAVFVLAAFALGRKTMRERSRLDTEEARLFALLAYIATKTQGAHPCSIEEMTEILQRFRIVRDHDDLLDLIEHAEVRRLIEVYKPTTPREAPLPVAYVMTNLGLTALGITRGDWLRRSRSNSAR